MITVDNLLDGSATIKDAAAAFIEDPLIFFDLSFTKMQSVPRGLLEELQTEALSMRFEQQKERIPTLAKLVDRQGIKRVGEFNEVLPLLFQHTMYKSYPSMLLERGQFDKLTTWLNRLTPHDLSQVDTSKCNSIHSWLDLLCSETQVDPITSSGSTGTMSFTPRDKSDWRTQILGGFRTQLLQEFGKPRTEADIYEPLYVPWSTHPDGHTGLFRTAHYMHEYMAMGRDDHFYPMYQTAGDTDVMYLAAQLRAAQSRGDNRVNVPQSLLDRRAEIEAIEKDKPAKAAAWLDILVSKLNDKRVFLFAPAPLIYDVAVAGLAKGKRCGFGPDTAVMVGTGGKAFALPADWEDTVMRFLNCGGKNKFFYGFSEQTLISVKCSHGRVHMPPWSIPFILDPETSELLPRKGVQNGRGAFFDLALNGIWGGLITGDRIEIDWNECPCGQTTAHISDKITRFSVEQGGSDKISCTATPEAHNDALDFLTSF